MVQAVPLVLMEPQELLAYPELLVSMEQVEHRVLLELPEQVVLLEHPE